MDRKKKIIISVLAVVILAVAITLTIIFAKNCKGNSGKGENETDDAYNNSEEIDGSDDEHSKLY